MPEGKVPRHDRCGLADEDHEGGLKGILGIMVILKDSPANTANHRGVTLDENVEGRSLTAANEVLQQLPIRQFPIIPELCGYPKVLDDPVHRTRRHVRS